MCIAASSGEERLCAVEQCEVVRQLKEVKTALGISIAVNEYLMQWFLVSISTWVSGFFDKLLDRCTAHSDEQKRKKKRVLLFFQTLHI